LASLLASWSALVMVAIVLAPYQLSAQDQMQYPLAVTASANGDIYVADRQLPGIWKVSNGEATVFFRAEKKFGTRLNAVRCLAIDAQGQLLAGDSATRDIWRFNPEGGDPVALTKGAIGIPMGIAVDGEGNLLVTDLELHCVWKVPAAGGKPEKLAEVRAPSGITIDGQGRAWIVSRGVDPLKQLLPDGTLKVVVAGRPFKLPHGVVLDDQGTAYVTDGFGKAVWKIAADAEPEKLAADAPLINPVGITRLADKLIVADPRARTIFSIDAAGSVTAIVASPE